uniref:Uncharacterized protein n=1 Tax=Cyprinus carpio TaxID=7962 RepID=A0A8C2QAS7_CYPCA
MHVTQYERRYQHQETIRLKQKFWHVSDAKHQFKSGMMYINMQMFSLSAVLMEQMREGCRRLFVIDEIRKMELFSRAVRQTLDASSCSILGTIPVPKGKPLALVEEVRSRQAVKIFMITKETRDVIFDDIVSAVQECLN